ncbi:MAG: MotA/TolQ/ExbB proton channel family protein [Thiobacillus sp.]|nr:MotA/TolQ/ExbB proton channel family protein [Thiobacillus sp.]
MENLTHPAPLGVAHFIAQADGVAQFLLLALLAMSIVTWSLIAAKLLGHWRMKQRARHFLQQFWAAPNLSGLIDTSPDRIPRDPFSHLADHALRAAEQYRSKHDASLCDSGSEEAFMTRALRRGIDQGTAPLEYGHTVLASIASSAPFIGLFGTVWGIYHALVNIGMSGSGSLDQVAGPVGEALIMTALGLAVAIPAVLAYNFFNRGKRRTVAEVEGFAHELFAFMQTGVRHGPRDRGKRETARISALPTAGRA